MHFHSVVILVVCLNLPVNAFFGTDSLQDFVESLVDATKFKLEGQLNLNDSAFGRVWSMFKSNYGRAYSSIGSFHQENFKFIFTLFALVQTKKNNV